MTAPEDDVIISPSKKAGDPNLPATGLLFVNPIEANYAVSLARKANFTPAPLFNSNLLISPPDNASPFFLSGPAVGAPMAALSLEKLIACGARNIILMGWCGGLQGELKIGDIVLPTGAVSEEGTSGHYPCRQPLAPSSTLTARLHRFLLQKDQAVHDGSIWSTDAPYRETNAKVTRYGEAGVLGVDMEFAALCAVAAFRGVSLAAALLVSDLLSPSSQWRPGYSDKTFRKKSRQLAELLLSFAEENF